MFKGLFKTLPLLMLAPVTCAVLAEDSNQYLIESTNALLPLSWEELNEMDVSTLARTEQTVKDTPAAAFVITAEDIRRSGANSLPDVLRMVPGMDVAQVNSWSAAVSARGFSDLYANKLQVMIDGRSIYDPLVSGVFWEQHNPFLQDIERIEVLRGPSGSLWGANAVNGTINIVTRSAKQTQGGLLSVGGGSKEHGFGGLRYGAQISDSTFVRGTVNGLQRGGSLDLQGANTTQDYGNAQTVNLRMDSKLSGKDDLMLQANFSRFDINGYYIGVTSPDLRSWQASGYGRDGVSGTVQGSWSRQIEGGEALQLNMSATQTEWSLAMNQMRRTSVLMDFQHSLPVFGSHHALWGVNYQAIADQFENSVTLSFLPERFTQHNVGVFLQDQIDLASSLKLTLGNRIEHFTYTGWETEPNARLLWSPNKQHRLWAAVSRAVVLPNRAQHSIHLYKQIPGSSDFVSATANPDTQTENLVAYELGWRWQMANNLDLDTAMFYNIYDRMQGTQIIDSDLMNGIYYAKVGNYRQVTSYGLETVVNYRFSHDWRLQASA